ncbi:MAG: macro domain-containing protein [Saccharofermentans sp.]|nr:macro domain-containing protein [Saccharofermentans sp.]
MPLKIVRNDITKMTVDAVINTAASSVNVGPGCDHAIYIAAGFDKLMAAREVIGEVPEGGAFITPGFDLPARFIIHAVSPLYIDGESGEEELLRGCYRNCLNIALKQGLSSIAFPLISTGSFGYPREEGMRIAVDEISAFLLTHDMLIYIVVFDAASTNLGARIAGSLEQYIDDKYVDMMAPRSAPPMYNMAPGSSVAGAKTTRHFRGLPRIFPKKETVKADVEEKAIVEACYEAVPYADSSSDISDSLDARIAHLSDTFSEYLLYLIERQGMSNSDVYKRAVVDKKVFSKIKNNPSYHPNKLTALCLCVGAKLCLDDTKDLLARAGYALSPCDKTDVIFSYFIEHEMFDIIEIDIALEEHGLPCLIV